MKLSAETIAKMQTVINAVLAQPEYYDQEMFPYDRDSECGTICCGAGWAVWVDSPARYKYLLRRRRAHWSSEANKILGIKSGDKLFYSSDYWPDKYRMAYRRANTPKQRARAMADRWNHYIATDGAE